MHMGNAYLGDTKENRHNEKCYKILFVVLFLNKSICGKWMVDSLRSMNRNVKLIKKYLTKLYYCIIVLLR